VSGGNRRRAYRSRRDRHARHYQPHHDFYPLARICVTLNRNVADSP
jgi:hypothetical protein